MSEPFSVWNYPVCLPYAVPAKREGVTIDARVGHRTGQAGESRKHGAAHVELNDTDSPRHWALTEYLHKTAALEWEVISFRSEILGGPYNTLSRSEALRRIKEAECPLLPVT
jgi:hypothetical protein